MSEHTIATLCQRSRDISLEKGWLNPDGTDPRPFHTVIALFHSELSEAFEDIRNNYAMRDVFYEVVESGVNGSKILSASALEARKADGRPIHSAKPCGIPSELADFVIRVCQYYGSASLGKKLEEVMGEISQAKLGTYPAADPELLITELHDLVSKAWSFSKGETSRISGVTIDYLATALLSLFDFCKKKDINLWAAIEEKEAYNRTRSHKHGGKKV